MSYQSQVKNQDINDLLDKIDRGEFTVDGEKVQERKMTMFEQLYRETQARRRFEQLCQQEQVRKNAKSKQG